MRRNSTGFTLAELLIALAILGVIAAFAIPKVLQSQQIEQKRAIMRETAAVAATVLAEAANNGVDFPTSFVDYALGRLNCWKSVKYSATNGMCWLHTGASLRYNVGTRIDTGIDYNADLGANTAGDDLIVLYGIYQTAGNCGAAIGRIVPYSPTCGATGYGDAVANEALYQWIFSAN